MLKAESISVLYDQTPVVKQVSFTLEEGQWLMLVGPNGAGKSTLVSAIAQSVPYAGRFTLEGRDLQTFKPAQLARSFGVLAQRHQAGYAFTVEEVVRLGRYAYRGSFLAQHNADGQAQVEQALHDTGMDLLRNHSVLTLSGGEMQRVFLAQVFAQNPRILLLDEPANHLDLPYQKHVFTLIQAWLKQPGRAVLSVVHDLSLAKRYGTHALLLDNGHCVTQGELGEVLTPANLERVYGMDVYGWMLDMLTQWQ